MDESQTAGAVSDGAVATSGTTVEATTEAPSASAEQTPSTEVVTSEKTQGTEGTENAQATDGEGNSIPYDRFAQVNSEKNELKAQVSELQQKAALLDKLRQDPSIANEFLKNMPRQETDPVRERADKQLREMGYITQEDAQSMVQQELQRNELRSKVVERMDSLEKKFDGSNGLPPFIRDEVVDYMDKHGFTNDEFGVPDVEKTFKMMHLESFIDSGAKEKKSTFSEKPGKAQSRTADDSGALVAEAKKTGDWQQVFASRSRRFK